MDEEEIDVVNYEPEIPMPNQKIAFQCESCNYIGRSERSLSAHRRHKHPKPPESLEKSNPQKSEVPPERVTTKQLLGGRRRPKTVVENVEESAMKTDREASRLHGLGLIDEETSLGEYVRRGNRGVFPLEAQIDEQAGNLVVGEEVIIDINDEETQNNFVAPKPRALHRKYQSGILPERLTLGDPNGKYACYVENCGWRGGYRSLRMDHIRAIHPEWKKPSRFILEKISKQGIYLNPEEHVPEFPCLVEGCPWRGNYRASRSSHMKKVHPMEHAEIKKKAPGYNSNGHYRCHYPMCTWRGWSRSTRSMHLKKAHPEWRAENFDDVPLLTCFHCKSTFPTYPLLVQHIETHGGSGLHVEETFDSKDQFSAWLQRVERVYSITFERSDIENAENDHYELHCNCVAARGSQLAADARQFIYSKHNFLKRRNHQFLTRGRTDCSAYLDIREPIDYGQIIVRGSLEHTGHRFGTPLLRMTNMDRQLYGDTLEWKAEKEFRFMALDVVEKLNSYEGFTMDNYSPVGEIDLIEPLDEDPEISFKKIIDQSDATCFFGVDFSRFGEHPRHFSLGYQTNEMQRLWAKYGPDRTATIEVNLVDFDGTELFQYVVLISDDMFIPKCVLIYLTTQQETGPETVLQHLKNGEPRGPREFMCDPSQMWVDLVEKLYPRQSSVLISEWTILDYWAAKVEQLVPNEFDVFSIVTSLRRIIRTDEPNQLLFYFLELFESLFECSYDKLAEFFDAQLTDLEYFKRWSPVHRNSYTSHSHPTLAVAARTLRTLYLCSEDFDRLDQWFAHAIGRIHAFNEMETTQTYTLRPLDEPRKYFYNVLEQRPPEGIQQGEILVYEDEFVEGDVVVEEEVIGHEEVIGEDEEELVEQVIRDDDGTIIYEEEVRTTEPPEEEEMVEATTSMEMIPESNLGAVEETVTIESSVSPPKPHPILHEPKEVPMQAPPPPLPPMSLPKRTPKKDGPPTRETTKTVIRAARKRRDRFAELRQCPPEIMRAIAAHAIGFDGRKKEQRPFIATPMPAQMGRNAHPVVATPDLRPYGALPTQKLTPAQIAEIQQQRRDRREQHWNRFRQLEKAQIPQSSTSSVEPSHHRVVDDDQPCTSASLYQ